MINKPGIYVMKSDAYQADPAPAPSLSASIAKLLVLRTPKHAWTAHPRLNPNFRREERYIYDRGNACHALTLEGVDRMAVIPFENFRGKDAKEMRDIARARGLHPVLEADVQLIHDVRESVLAKIAACPDFDGMTLTDGAAEQSMFWTEGAGEDLIYCRARSDWRAFDGRVMFDLKTTDTSAHPDAWEKTMRGMGADIEAAFHMRGHRALGGDSRVVFVFGVVEMEPPHACSLISLSNQYLEFAERKAEEARATWRRCMKTNNWPAYTNRICYLEPPAWALTQWDERDDTALGIPYEPGKLFARETDPAV